MPKIHPKTWEDGVMPLSEFSPERRAEIERLVARDTPPPRWKSYVGCQMESRAWYEWHWARGLRLRYAPGDGPLATSRRSIPAATRASVYERDGYVCVTCGASEDLTLDHVHPYSLGGADTADNLQTMCRPCNSRKGARI